MAQAQNAAINRFGVDTNHLERWRIYTLHTREGKFHGRFMLAGDAGAWFTSLNQDRFFCCNATQIAEYEGR